ncbi:hypothetical protein BVY04_03395, partial [bacterium M21]
WAPASPDIVNNIHIPKAGNNSKDITIYKIEYYTQPWTRDASVDQYIVRLHKGPDTVAITLSILSTDADLSATDAITAMLTRWVQENNIGYLIQHHGINEITSYKHYTYEQAAEKLKLDDYLTDNPTLRQLVTQKLQLRNKRAILKMDIEDRIESDKAAEQRHQGECEELDRKIKTTPDKMLIKELKKKRSSIHAKLKGTPRRYQKFLTKKIEKITQLEEQIQVLEVQAEGEPKKVQRIEYLISKEYDRLNFGPKACMDAIRLLGHNIHRYLHDRFRPLYDNYRNDHRIIRELIQCPAFLKETPAEYLVALIPARLHGRTISVIEELINQLPPIQTANGKPLRLQLNTPLQGVQSAI